LGGQMLLNRLIPQRHEMITAPADLASNLAALNVEILLNKKADAALVKDMEPDAVVIATGAKPIIPDIPGIDGQNVVQAWDVLAGGVAVGENVVILGGNAVGLETALYLANQGTLSPEVLHFLMANRAESLETLTELLNKGNKSVTVVEMIKKAGVDIGLTTRWTVMAELKRLGVIILTGTKATGVRPDGLEIEREDGSGFLPADTIVIAAGSRSERRLSDELEKLVPEVYTIGDAGDPRKALDAIREGYLTGLKI
jgi:2,4-dienoyl-CoA reductase (NADPH2)